MATARPLPICGEAAPPAPAGRAAALEAAPFGRRARSRSTSLGRSAARLRVCAKRRIWDIFCHGWALLVEISRSLAARRRKALLRKIPPNLPREPGRRRSEHPTSLTSGKNVLSWGTMLSCATIVLLFLFQSYDSVSRDHNVVLSYKQVLLFWRAMIFTISLDGSSMKKKKK